MFKCQSCNGAFVYPLPSDDYLRNYYDTFHASLEDGGGYEIMEGRMAADFHSKIRIVKSCFPLRLPHLLDVGCGKGYFVKACIDAGIPAEGIDLSETAIEWATQSLGVPAVCGSIEEHIDAVGLFDAVTCWATIEHVTQPVETLKAIRKVLKPGGRLFLDTGIGHDYLDRMLPGFVQWYDPPQHLHVFSKQSVGIALSHAGFTLQSIDSCFERTLLRRVIRIVRGLFLASGMRLVAEMGFMSKSGPFHFTRFPVGNLMSVVAINTADTAESK
jgi:SAM-dependent methyltransferase